MKFINKQILVTAFLIAVVAGVVGGIRKIIPDRLERIPLIGLLISTVTFYFTLLVIRQVKI